MEVSGQRHAPVALPRKIALVITEWEAFSAPEAIWTIRRREKNHFSAAEIRTSQSLARSLVIVLTVLSGHERDVSPYCTCWRN